MYLVTPAWTPGRSASPCAPLSVCVDSPSSLTCADHRNVGVCNIDGNYSVNFTVYYTGYNGTGSTLPPDQNPIPLNSSALVTFVLHSADFCANFIHPDISAVLNTYNQNLVRRRNLEFPELTFQLQTDYYTGPTPPWQGFLTGNTIYLAARVTSDNLPILYGIHVLLVPNFIVPALLLSLPSTHPPPQTRP